MAKAKSKSVVGKFPKTIGACIDRMAELDRERSGHTAAIVLINDAYFALETHLKKEFGRKELQGAKGNLAMLEVDDENVPQITDWDAVYKFIVKHNAFELLHKRMSTTAWRERLEAKKPVPGTVAYKRTFFKLTLRKAGGGRAK